MFFILLSRYGRPQFGSHGQRFLLAVGFEPNIHDHCKLRSIVASPTEARSATTARLNPCKKKSMPLVNNLPLLDGHPAMIHPKEVRDLAIMFDVHNAEVSLLAGFKGPDAVGSA